MAGQYAAMNFALAIIAALTAGAAMWFATAVQHHLYSRAEHRVPGDTGRRRVVRRAGVSIVAALAAGIAFRPDHYDFLPALLCAVAAWSSLLAASTDFERRLIPNRITYPLALLAAVACWVWPDRSPLDIAYGAVAAIILGVALFVFGEVIGLLLRVRATVFGLGDVKLILVIGLLLGWPAMLSGLLIGVIAAGIPGVVLTLAGRGRKVFPYGPFLVLGALIPLLWPANFV